MIQFVRTPLLLASVAGLLAGGIEAATGADVRDDAGFFSQSARETANAKIAEMRRQTGRELRVETFDAPPADKGDVSRMSKAERDRFFDKWARERATDAQVRGVYIGITRNPGHVQVEVGRQTREQGFVDRERGVLRDRLVAGFRDKQYDRTLLDAVDYVGERFSSQPSHRGTSATPVERSHPQRDNRHAAPGGERDGASPWSGWMGWVILAVLVFLAFRVIGGLINMFSGNRPGHGGVPGGYGGGGLFGGLMTGLFGAFVGNWIYDSFFGHSAQAHDSPANHHRSDDDYSGSGGDFGDSGGGGDDFSGGGDFGGGDFGGGDFGGGDF